MATRFDYQIIARQCKKDDCFEGGKPHEFVLAIDERFGKGAAAKLFNLSKTTEQWEIGELEQLTVGAKHSYLAYTTLYDQLCARSIKTI